jgi:hypothetical protein
LRGYIYANVNPTRYTDPSGQLIPGGGSFVWHDPALDIEFEAPPPEHLGRVQGGIDIVTAAVITSRRCQLAFSEARHGKGCAIDPTALDLLRDTEVYRWTHAPKRSQSGDMPMSIFADGRALPAVGYVDLVFRLGKYALTHTFIHEMAHYAAGRGHSQVVRPQDVALACGLHLYIQAIPTFHFIDQEP